MTTNLHLPPPKPPNHRHLPWNYTWMVLSERNDVVWDTPKTSTNIWWPASLSPNLCKLVQGAEVPWGIEDQLDLYKAPEDNVPSTQSYKPYSFFSLIFSHHCSVNLAGKIPLGEPYFKIQIFVFAQGTTVATPSIISVMAKLIFIVPAGVVRPQGQFIGILRLPGLYYSLPKFFTPPEFFRCQASL